jgi:hypothetical protein
VNRIHTAGRFFAAAGILGAGVLAFAAPAAADTSQSVTVDNTSSLTVSNYQAINLAAVAAATCQGLGITSRIVSLSLTGPIGPDPVTETVRSTKQTCSQEADLAAAIPSPKRNGEYSVMVENGSSSDTATAELDVLIPPTRAQDLAVTTAGTIASFTWTANSEADITSYQITGANGAVSESVDAGTACSGSSCSTNVDLGPSAAGRTDKFSVNAVRCGISCADGVSGARSASVAATFPAAPPTPTPTPAPTTTTGTGSGGGSGTGSGSGSGTGTGSGSGSGSGTGAGSGSGTGSGGSGSTGGGLSGKVAHGGHLPSVGAGAIPTLNAPTLPGLQTEIKPLVLGKAGGKIQYPAPKIATKKKVSGVRAISNDIASGLTLPPLWRGIAAAAVLLLIAVHLKAWASRTDFV